jgi:hypothetical protein
MLVELHKKARLEEFKEFYQNNSFEGRTINELFSIPNKTPYPT